MGDSFKFTLYEFFGYLLPGAVALIGLSLLDLVFFHRAHAVSLGWCSTKQAAVAAIGLSYLLGHAVQILANAILPETNMLILRLHRYNSTQELLKRTRSTLPQNLIDQSDRDIVVMCEHEVKEQGPSENREIYIYREGFYRGMFISLVIVSIPAFLIAIITNFALFAMTWGTHRAEAAIGAVLILGMAVGMYYRSLRFANYRIVQALMCHILSIDKSGVKKAPK
jgi:hypothetical protein